MCSCNYDLPSIFQEVDVRARKFQSCDECRGWIAPGEVYRRSFGVWDGRAEGFKTCSDCTALAGWAEDQNGDDICYSLGNMIADVGDCLGEMGDRTVCAELSMRWREVRAKRRSVGISA